MPEMNERLRDVIETLEQHCQEWIGRDEKGNCVLIDPHEGEPIGAHYGMSHYAAALLLGHTVGSPGFDRGLELLNGVLSRWPEDSRLPGYHNDFNNMALCMVEQHLSDEGIEPNLCERIRRTVLETPDSNNPTVNWLPMRIYVNIRREAWGKDTSATVKKIESDIGRSWHADGFIEDRLPKGVSFNLQYDAATVAVLAYLNTQGKKYDLEKATKALVNALGPDGDINYLGRGCNQIFAWGLWLYLLKLSGQRRAFETSFSFFEHRISTAIDHDNVLLNGFPGEEKDFWWDYHYASVYFPHLLLWLGECQRLPERWIDDYEPSEKFGSDSGMEIVRDRQFFLAAFSGRKEYRAERGPMVAQVALPNGRPLVKASFGPYLKHFGEKRASAGVLLNHFGLMRLEALGVPSLRPVWSYRRWDRAEDGSLLLTFEGANAYALMNIPLTEDAERSRFSVSADGAVLDVREIGKVKSPYGYVALLQSQPAKAKVWQVRISL